ncbi:MAG: hypothetical protein ACM31P_16140 [Actinomycetota bacterium]
MNSDGAWIPLRLAMEPPFRIVVRALLKRLKVSVKTRALWEVSKRPAYLLGVLTAAEQAIKQKVPEISVIEFGVAGGEGLVALQEEAEAVERETGVRIRVYGFDAGAQGLPAFIGDYRDHPDAWQPGDYPMDEAALRARLTGRTTLILGNVRDTIKRFYREYQPPPVGFVSFDLDLYSSTRDALQIFSLPDKRMLWNVPLYFDDIEFLFNHRFAGELLAIDEFNEDNEGVKIDRWHGVKMNRPFPERPFLEKMYVAHDLEAISRADLGRAPVTLPLSLRERAERLQASAR